VAAALSHHPSLTALRARAEALDAASEKARYLPDPQASASSGRLAETAAGQVQGTLGVQQKIPFPGKRSAQAAVLAHEAQAIQAQLRNEELALAQRVREAWWNYYLASSTTKILTENKDLLTTLRSPVEARIATNQGAQQDLLKLENEITRIEQRLSGTSGQEQSARASLNALLVRPAGADLPAPRTQPFQSFGPADSLTARAHDRHPEVLRARALIASADSQQQLAALTDRPDFTAGLAWTPVSEDGLSGVANGEDQFMATLGITLPIWSGKNTATRREAAARLAAAQSSLASARTLLQQEIGSAHASFIAEREALAPYEARLIPNARDSFDLTLTSYQNGNASFLDIIDTARQLLRYQLAQEENQARLGKAQAALRKAAAL
jgi:outer membrane protein TolC